jgi:hypothetical protein
MTGVPCALIAYYPSYIAENGTANPNPDLGLPGHLTLMQAMQANLTAIEQDSDNQYSPTSAIR